MKNRMMTKKLLSLFVLSVLMWTASGCLSNLCPGQMKCDPFIPPASGLARRYAVYNYFTENIRTTHQAAVDNFGCFDLERDTSGNCPGPLFVRLIFTYTVPFTFFLTTQSPVDLNAPPTTLDFSGEGIDPSGPMPMIDYYDAYGRYVATVQATACSSTWCCAPGPDFSQCYSGTYTAVISQMTPEGFSHAFGQAYFTTYGRDLPDNDQDLYPSIIDCDDFDPNVNPGQEPDCSGMYFDRNCDGIPDNDQCQCGSPGNFCELY